MNFRRFNKYICALTLAAACTVSAMGATISDVTKTHWAYTAVMDMADRGIMVPTSAGEFKPNQTMNYFEVADVIAKATGYVDVDVATNVDETFKQQIKTNYEKQKATLATYAAKYSTWDKTYDQQVAYILGRGYISTSDLDTFITKSNNGETKNVMTKETLSVLLVRLLGKENTAKTTYTSTGFKDEASIKEAYRPHMAYLKNLGIINPDASGNANPSTKITKALCAQMVSNALKEKEGSQGSNSGTETAKAEEVTIKRVLTKNTTEYYVSLTRGGTTSYYTIKNTTKVLDATGKEVKITDIPADTKARATIELENNTEYITSLQLTDSLASNEDNTGTENTQVTTVSGTLVGNANSGFIRLTIADGTVKTYLLEDNCQITLNGASVTADKLTEGSTLVVTVANSSVTKIVATSTGTSSQASNGELTAKKLSAGGYVFTLKQNNSEATVTIPETAKIKRNNKTVSVQEIRLGDTIKVTRTNGVVTEVEATGTRQTVTGTIKEIHLAQPCKIVVNVNNESMTYTFASDAELYDNSVKKYIGVRDLHLGQEVSFIVDSKEVISLDVENISSSVKLMGTITNVSKNNDYMDVLVDYDPVTGESKVYKRIEMSSNTTVVLNGRTQNRNVLEEDMEVVIIYQYLDDTMPQKIQIIQ